MFAPTSLPRTLEAALRDARSAKASVRASALRDLAAHADVARDEVLSTLEAALSDAEPEVRAASATSLADVRAVEALDALLEAVDDPEPLVQQLALRALGELGEARALPRVRRALGEARPEARFQAIVAFSRLASDEREVFAALRTALADDDAEVRHIAFRVVEEVAEVRDLDVPEGILAVARRMLDDPSSKVRVAAAVLLGRTGDDAGRDVLIAAVARELACDPEDEAAAVELAGELGLEVAARALKRRATSGILGIFRDPLAWHARVALARLGHDETRRALLRELERGSADDRTLAAAALGRARVGEARARLVELGARGLLDARVVDEAVASIDGGSGDAGMGDDASGDGGSEGSARRAVSARGASVIADAVGDAGLEARARRRGGAR